jgi:hypothetical protein
LQTSPFLQGCEQKKKRGYQQYVVKAGEIEYCIKRFGDQKSGQLSTFMYKPCRVHNFSHPVAREGQDIPQDNKPKEAFELKPPRSDNPVVVNTKKQVNHADNKKDMPYLVGYESFCTPMLLDGKSWFSREQDKYGI